eukprot:TRINITY_DN5547_c0_g1_i1.p1 TRINITY_DN5547_c0_g1~~TRINITY_DN5547_c0_g1_i1.p1  ORF type:complete len:251 (+),score=83.08 TRINITY_DN5547_c0_g1_i1:83-835(+)
MTTCPSVGSTASSTPRLQARVRRRTGVAGTACRTLLAASLVLSAVAEDTNVVKLTKFNFDSNVKNGAWFVKFYAPWCVHCQRMKPMWSKLADAASKKEWDVHIAEVDCTSSKEVCERVGVKAFPLLALIKDGALKAKYQGEPSLENFEQWLNKQVDLGQDKDAPPTVIVTDQGGKGPKKSNVVQAEALDALKAVAMNLLSKYPTTNKNINAYVYGGSLIAIVVGFFKWMLIQIEAEEAEEMRRQASQKRD